MFFGKLIAGLLGFLLLGWVGLVLGLLVGHAFDRGLARNIAFTSPEQLDAIRQQFSETCFTLLGVIAKADGRVSPEEITQAEHIMTQLGIEGSQRQAAIDYFKQGAEPDFQIEPAIASFLERSQGHRQLNQTLLMFLITMALADGVIDRNERQVMESCARQMGFDQVAFNHLLGMIEAQSHFHSFGESGSADADMLSDAYRALGVAPDSDERTVKRAYRKLMSENHPDKLIARGVPEAMVKIATEKSQEITAAYELIKKSA
ncbi:co-chaperone DjlA [Halieaceae bacterium IMCC14734]|uniref:Co-chaperone DjlA n=1 Tax=Candidatus Litorirhabdus singularis TaxID=2518993 RepID=A0ABT3TCD5_9GAMM|nr:co-chaperone DjlA [Candidatus Litorirhabdus singularis]MCX2979958.1 co-chaperone DjlA [Candidatus Litorirhabdus singularis]